MPVISLRNFPFISTLLRGFFFVCVFFFIRKGCWILSSASSVAYWNVRFFLLSSLICCISLFYFQILNQLCLFATSPTCLWALIHFYIFGLCLLISLMIFVNVHEGFCFCCCISAFGILSWGMFLSLLYFAVNCV